MSAEEKRFPADTNAELIAYLDGELDAESCQRLERRLVEDASLRALLREFQQAWDLLDDLPRVTVGDGFQRSTVETAVLSVAGGGGPTTAGSGLFRGGVAAAILVAAVVGYLVTARMLSAPQRQLTRDLPVIRQLDAYQHIDGIEFLRDLAAADLFPTEEPDVR